MRKKRDYDTNMPTSTIHDKDEAMVAQCLVSMAGNGPQSSVGNLPEPPFVSEDDCELQADSFDSTETTTSTQLNKRIKIDGMIPSTDLPDPNQWENEQYSSTPG